jgi:hypothetical protein
LMTASVLNGFLILGLIAVLIGCICHVHIALSVWL